MSVLLSVKIIFCPHSKHHLFHIFIVCTNSLSSKPQHVLSVSRVWLHGVISFTTTTTTTTTSLFCEVIPEADVLWKSLNYAITLIFLIHSWCTLITESVYVGFSESEALMYICM